MKYTVALALFALTLGIARGNPMFTQIVAFGDSRILAMFSG